MKKKAEGDGFCGHSDRFGSVGHHDLQNQPRPTRERERERAGAVVASLCVRRGLCVWVIKNSFFL